MQLTQYSQKLQMLEWAEGLRAIAERRGDTAAARAIAAEIQEFSSGRFMLAVMGKVKRGKSTFCNAFLGRNDDLLAPINKEPATSVISKFLRGENESCLVHFRDGRRSETVDYRQIKDFVTEEANHKNQKGVDCVEIVGRFAGLEKDLTLVDTPGAGSIHEHHDALLFGFLPQADAVIFLVTADQPIAADELELLRQLKAADIKKVFFAINKVDDPHTDEDEIVEGIAHNRKMLGEVGLTVDKIYRISALKAMRGELENSGFPELFADVSRFLAEHKLRILQAKFTGRVSGLASGLANSLAVELGAGAKSVAELNDEIAALKERREKLAGNRAALEGPFLRQWTGAVERFEVGVSEAEEVVGSKVLKKISDTGVLSVNNLTKELPAFLNNAIESELQDASSTFERASRDAVEKLRVDYPQVSFSAIRGEIVVRTGNTSDSLLKGTIAGAGAAVAGAGLAVAASSAAAAVAATNAAAIAAAAATNAAAIAAAAATNAAAIAAASAATVPTSIAAAGPLALVGNLLGGFWGGLLSWFGTATVATTAVTTTVTAPVLTVPVLTAPVLTATPVWVALAGPIGWTLAGVGALVIPFAYRISKLKLKDQLEQSSREHIRTVFRRLKSDQVRALAKMGSHILEEFKSRLENDLTQIECALRAALERKQTNAGTAEIEKLVAELDRLVRRVESWK